ncbi:MAG: cysE, partial [Collimonas fungivorans]|uniref:serine O-acetyltransferase n=1 Tax=Collimonas fungivorans TaxID=158899 RepID=UPI0026F1C94A
MSSRNFSEQQALTDSSGLGLEQVVSALRTSREVTNKIRHRGDIRELPSRQALAEVLQGLSAALFPTHYGRTDLNDETIDHFVGNTLSFTLNILAEQIRRGLLFVLEESTPEADLNRQAIAVTRQFAAGLPAIRDLLASDIQAAYSGDPAATSISEILLCYPGTTAIIYHRLAHALHGLGAPLLARLIADIAHSATGIDIHPAAQIGASFFIDHGTGVVIGETTIIGQRVRLYQAVTLGAKRFPADQDGALIKGN